MTDSNFTVTGDISYDPVTGQTVTTAGDGSTFNVDLPPASHAPHPEMIVKLDHVLEHLHQINDKIDALHQRLDEHANDMTLHHHQPLEGHIVLHPVHTSHNADTTTEVTDGTTSNA